MKAILIRGGLAVALLIGAGVGMTLIAGFPRGWNMVAILTGASLALHAPIIIIATLAFPRSSTHGKLLRLIIIMLSFMIAVVLLLNSIGFLFAIAHSSNSNLSLGYDHLGMLVLEYDDPQSGLTQHDKHYHGGSGYFRYAISPWVPAYVVMLCVLILIEYLNHRFKWRPTYVEYYLRWGQTTACNRCGYNLTGNESGVCPECGLTITLKYMGDVTEP